ncbi:MAG TPA: response regulator [Mesotoga sp.]|jgi:CheY-like chemotaxis protein|nr:response regulator [Mesotoga sp.]MDD4040856.1 response regulator [Mesotoga sp.]MDD4479333.1 response regulator [Mesotoga sp.]MDD5745337.1 response regulator [Mesotoga sp.]HOI63815.1 response regulator [Mesotoga sp.]
MIDSVVEILLVEDNPEDIELTLRALKKSKLANNIVVAEDGEEALDFIFARGKYSDRSVICSPKVILLDLKLPKVSGIEVLREIKKDPRTSIIPVVILTSSTQEVDIEESYKLGANSYIVKPVNFENFIQSLRQMNDYWLVLNRLPSR